MNKAQWTLMIYMAGDNTLSPAGELDVDEMRKVGSTDKVNVVVLYDGFGNAGAARGRIQKDGAGESIESLKEINTGDPTTLIEFVDWAATHYPAERYGLILWSHGNGWQPYEIKQVAQKVSTLNFDNQERSVGGLKHVLFRPTLEEILSLPTTSERAICMDDSSAQSLDTVELGKALKAASEKLGQKLEFLGMDACLMSNFEVAFQAYPFVNYMIASEEVEPDSGWPYRAILKRMTEKPDLPTQDIVEYCVTSYVGGRMGAAKKTLTALNLAMVPKIAEQLTDAANVLTVQLPKNKRKLWAALQQATSFEQFTLWDIAHFCGELKREKFDDTVIATIDTLQQSLVASQDGFVISHMSNDERLAQCGGVSIYIPAPPEIGLSRYYTKIAFAKQTSWPAFLQAMKSN